MSVAEIDEQIKRLKGYLEHTRESWRDRAVPTAEHLAAEQALALAYIARAISQSEQAPAKKDEASNSAKP